MWSRAAAGHPLAHCALIVAFGLAAFGGSLHNGFVWDDAHIIVDNPRTKDLSRLGEVMLSPDEVAPYYRPLNRASYLVDHALFGMDPRGFHAVSLLLHLANAVLLYWLARRLMPAGGALVAASLLAVHPINAEAVNFLSGRNNLFALLFSLVALLLLDLAVRRGRYRFAIASGAAFLLALMSKEQGAVVGAVAVVWLALVARGAGPVSPRRGLILLLPYGAAFAGYLVLRVVSLGGLLGPASGAAAGGAGVAARLAENWHVLPRYLWLVAFPEGLSIFHHVTPWPPTWALALTWAAGFGLVAATAWWRHPVAWFALGWFTLNYAPISNLVPIPSTALIAERYVYLPAVGLWILAGLAVTQAARRMEQRPELRSAALVVLGAVVTALTWRAAGRTGDWRDDVTLARSAVSADPLAVRAHHNLGVALREAGDLEGAVAAWEAALQVDPDDAETLTQLGIASAVSGHWLDAERALRRAVEADPSLGGAHFNLALLCEKTGRVPEAVTHYRAFLETATALDAALVTRAQARLAVLTGY